MQKSKIMSEITNLWPLFELISCLMKCDAAPTMNKIRNTIVIGTSTFLFGIPPRIAATGEKGPTFGWVIEGIVGSSCAPCRAGDAEGGFLSEGEFSPACLAVPVVPLSVLVLEAEAALGMVEEAI